MSLAYENWRKEELSLDEVIAKYPDVSRFVIYKTDVQRRGFEFSDNAKKQFFNDDSTQGTTQGIFGYDLPEKEARGIIFRDGTNVNGGHRNNEGIRDHYIIDYVDGDYYLTDNGKVIEPVKLWTAPDYYSKKTSKGNWMKDIVNCRPQRLDFAISRRCHFWDNPGEGCKYCFVAKVMSENKDKGDLWDYDEIAETVAEAVKQQGRFQMLLITTGSILSGEKIFDDEVNEVIKAMNKVKPIFKNDPLKTQLIASAYDKEQLYRIKEEAGIMTYTADLEVLHEEGFNWICPGKAKHVGYQEWKRRLYDAVDVFGKGNVNTGFVGGVETAQPYGFKDEKEALKQVVSELEELGAHGVSGAYVVWQAAGNFRNQIPPSLDYYVALAKASNEIREKNGIATYFDDYRRCGNHPATDLSRI